MEERKRFKVKSFNQFSTKEKWLLFKNRKSNLKEHLNLGGKILVLGMVYNNETTAENNMSIAFGQERRDLIRILGMIKLGYEIFSMDDKHNPVNGRHCNANFNNSRKMFKSMSIQQAYPINLRAKYIILDYFFSIEGWNSFRWSETFISDTLIKFVERSTLAWNGKIILPNMRCIKDYIDKNKILLDKYFTISQIEKENIFQNPLVYATEQVNEQLVHEKEQSFTNTNQLIRLDLQYPFYQLQYNKSINIEILNYFAV